MKTNTATPNPLISGIQSLPSSMPEIYRMLTSAPPLPEPEERRDDRLVRQMKLTALDKVYIPTARDIRSAISIFRMIVTGYEMRPPTADYWRDHDTTCRQVGLQPTMGSASAPAQAILGASGTGKSTSVENTLGKIPQVIVHDQKENTLLPKQQIVWIKVSCPVNRTPRSFIAEFFDSVDRLTGTSYSTLHQRRQNDEQLIVGMAKVARAHCLGLLVIDEIQNVVTKGRHQEQRLLKLFVNMTGTLRIPILFIGTPNALQSPTSHLAEARRMFGPQWAPFTQESTDWNMILDRLWEYQWTKTETPLTDELRAKVYELTQGIPALAKSLYILTQTRLILNAGKNDPELITPGVLDQTFEQDMITAHAAMGALKSGNPDEIPNDLLTPKVAKPVSIDKERERIISVGRSVFEESFMKTAKKAGREVANQMLRRPVNE